MSEDAKELADLVERTLYAHGYEDVLVEEDARTDETIFRVEVSFRGHPFNLVVLTDDQWRQVFP